MCSTVALIDCLSYAGIYLRFISQGDIVSLFFSSVSLHLYPSPALQVASALRCTCTTVCACDWFVCVCMNRDWRMWMWTFRWLFHIFDVVGFEGLQVEEWAHSLTMKPERKTFFFWRHRFSSLVLRLRWRPPSSFAFSQFRQVPWWWVSCLFFIFIF